MTIRIVVQLPESLVSQLDALVPGTHDSRSVAVRRSIEMYLYRLASEQHVTRYERQPLADDELALADDPCGWTGTPSW